MIKLIPVVLLVGGLVSCAGEEEVALISTFFGDMVVEFYADSAPQHVESFKILAQEGYFDSTTFHRVIPGFVIQGGDPNSRDDERGNDGQGGRAGKYFGLGKKDTPETWTIPAEFNRRLHQPGAVSMARSKDPNSAGSQFFICQDSIPRLDGQYTVFGQVIQGREVVERIVNVDTPRRLNPIYQDPDGDNPLEKVTMTVRILPRSQALGD